MSGTCPLCESRPQAGGCSIYDSAVCKRCYNDFATRRQFAFFLDMLIIRLLAIGAVVGLAPAAGSSDTLATALPVVAVYGAILFAFAKDGFSGHSPGKLLMGVRVVDDHTGSPANFWRSIQRNLPLIVPFLPLFVAFQLKKGPRLGDGWASTRVIWKKHALKAPFLAPARRRPAPVTPPARASQAGVAVSSPSTPLADRAEPQARETQPATESQRATETRQAPDTQRKPCPHCGEPASLDARLCPHCHHGLLVDVAIRRAGVNERDRYAMARALAPLSAGQTVGSLKRILDAGSGKLLSQVTRRAAQQAVDVARSHGGTAEIVGSSAAPAARPPRRWRPAAAALVVLLLAAAVFWWYRSGREGSAGIRIGEIAARSTASVRCGDQLGSGFFVAPDVLLTNAHVLCKDAPIEVVLPDGRTLPARAGTEDAWLDVARVLVPGADSMALPMGDALRLRQGEPVYFYGSPRGLDFTLSRALVSNLSRAVMGLVYIQLDGNVNPGNSGGPLFNADGEVVGIVTMMVGDSAGLGLALPVNYLYEGKATLAAAPSQSVDHDLWFQRARAAEAADRSDAVRALQRWQETRIERALVSERSLRLLLVRRADGPPGERAVRPRFRIRRGRSILCEPDGVGGSSVALSTIEPGWMDEATLAWLDRHHLTKKLWASVETVDLDGDDMDPHDGCGSPSKLAGLTVSLYYGDQEPVEIEPDPNRL